ncbi:hypothetical protein [Agrobacterium rosae]|uniref:hypothetical protein n=1 Tax=Agrobacterium rosae TaxID=1972867 RepID=UPI003BA06216
MKQVVFNAATGEITEENYTPAPAPLPTPGDVGGELERRLALGFDFNFGDQRGVHHFGTTPKDMERWTQEVTPLAQAATAKGDNDRQIGIKTETGPVAVTAAEWWDILDAAGEWRQPIYQAYFILKSTDPIPSDFATNPTYWP